ncbi:MAG: methionyl-tRNA formyltransferase, partial [Flammeovirgaceae bacterium]
VTTFFLKHEIDTGSIIFQEREPIYREDNVGTLYDRLMKKGAHLVLKTVQAIEKGNYPSTPQNELQQVKHAPKIFKETCQINWNQTREQVFNLVRGLNPHPAAWSVINGKTYKVLECSVGKDDDLESATGSYETDNKSYLYIKTSDGWISIEEFQPEG